MKRRILSRLDLLALAVLAAVIFPAYGVPPKEKKPAPASAPKAKTRRSAPAPSRVSGGKTTTSRKRRAAAPSRAGRNRSRGGAVAKTSPVHKPAAATRPAVVTATPKPRPPAAPPAAARPEPAPTPAPLRISAKAAQLCRASATDPSDASAVNRLGLKHYGTNDNENAAALFEAATTLAPDEPLYRLNLASASINLNRFAEARVQAEKAKSLGHRQPHWVFGYLNMSL